MTDLTAELARRAMALERDDLPDDVTEICRQCVLDWLGVTLAGSGEDAARLLFDELASDNLASDKLASDNLASDEPAPAPPTGGVTVVGRRERLPLHDAVMVNGTASHALDYDDVNLAMFGHPSVALLAALLGLAERERLSGSAVLVAFAAGYEAECRVARSLGGEHYGRGFHTTATVGAFGAALACCRLLGLDPLAAEMAVGIAATQAAGLKSMFGTMSKPLHAGRACAVGVLSARLAARGFTAAGGAIETTQGFAETHSASFDPALGLADPPGGWYLRSNLFKYHAACYMTHSSIEGLRRLRDAEAIDPHDVERVTVHADGEQMRMCAIPEPTTGLEVKFSLRHTAALALAGADTAAIATFADDRVGDPTLVALRDRVDVVADRADAGPTPVEVHLRDGRVLRAAHDVAVPEGDLALQGRRLAEKFTSLAAPVVGDDACRELAKVASEIDRLAHLDELLAATVPR